MVKKEAHIATEQKVIKGTKLVPVKKFKEVQETTVEIHEEVVHGYREVWKKVREPTTQVVKKRVPVTKTRTIPYMDYETKEVEMVVEVPKEVVKTRQGYRLDKHMGSKIVEVEEDHHYEMRPVRVQKGETRVTEHPQNYEHYGKLEHGAPVWDEHTHEGWRPELSRPNSAGSRAGSMLSRPGTSYSATGAYIPTQMDERPLTSRALRSFQGRPRTPLPMHS